MAEKKVSDELSTGGTDKKLSVSDLKAFQHQGFTALQLQPQTLTGHPASQAQGVRHRLRSKTLSLIHI